MKIVIYDSPPIPIPDLIQIQRLLQREDPFLVVFNTEEIGKYDCRLYLSQKDLHGIKTFAMFDRNVFSYVISLAKGDDVTRLEAGVFGPRRIAAAVMAFLQCSNVTVERGIPLYEGADTIGTKVASDERQLFRLVDNMHPQVFADIALGRRDTITKEELDRVKLGNSDCRDFSNPPGQWHRNHVLALKIALLEMEQIPAERKMESFLHWMHDEFFFGAAATMFAGVYLSPKRTGDMMKKLRSRDRNKALLGVRNAAWDLMLISHWGKEVCEQNQTNTIWLLCSRDVALKKIAKASLTHEFDEARVESILRDFLTEFWGTRKAKRFVELSRQLHATRFDPSRKAKQNRPMSYWKNLEAQLERQLLGSVSIS